MMKNSVTNFFLHKTFLISIQFFFFNYKISRHSHRSCQEIFQFVRIFVGGNDGFRLNVFISGWNFLDDSQWDFLEDKKSGLGGLFLEPSWDLLVLWWSSMSPIPLTKEITLFKWGKLECHLPNLVINLLSFNQIINIRIFPPKLESQKRHNQIKNTKSKNSLFKNKIWKKKPRHSEYESKIKVDKPSDF